MKNISRSQTHNTKIFIFGELQTGYGREEYADEYREWSRNVHHYHIVGIFVQRLNIFRLLGPCYVLSGFQKVGKNIFCQKKKKYSIMYYN